MQARYAMLTVDAEALPRRASRDHVERLLWGRHARGTAGIRELCEIGDEFSAKHVFFVDLCGAYGSLNEMREVITWLDASGQDVQLHAHPEVLPDSFWAMYSLSDRPALMNQYEDVKRFEFVLRHTADIVSSLTRKKVLAFRAGSFRWNARLIQALGNIDIPLSFNNSMRAFVAGHCPYAQPTNSPYLWSNGVIEVPVSEKLVLPQPGGKPSWASLTYPESPYFPFRSERRSWLNRFTKAPPSFSVFLMHSWSLLYWDEKGHATYKDDQRLEGYRKLLRKLTKDYDVITTREFLDLHARGKIPISNTVDIEKAAYKK